MADPKQGYNVILQVLNEVLEAENPISAADIGKQCNISRHQTHRALTALERSGWSRHTSKGWMLGSGVQQRLMNRAANFRRRAEELFKQAELKLDKAKEIENAFYEE